MREPSDVARCSRCGALMISIYTTRMTEETKTSPALREWRWWCGCGNDQEGGWYIAAKVNIEDEPRHRLWKLINALNAPPVLAAADNTGEHG